MSPILAAFFEFSGLAFWMSVAGLVLLIFLGVQHFLHPLGVPGVPLAKLMPAWIPARAVIDYLTGAFLIVGGVCFLLPRKTRVAATYLGTWILLRQVRANFRHLLLRTPSRTGAACLDSV